MARNQVTIVPLEDGYSVTVKTVDKGERKSSTQLCADKAAVEKFVGESVAPPKEV